jgi:hypothetical protein
MQLPRLKNDVEEFRHMSVVLLFRMKRFSVCDLLPLLSQASPLGEAHESEVLGTLVRRYKSSCCADSFVRC